MLEAFERMGKEKAMLRVKRLVDGHKMAEWNRPQVEQQEKVAALVKEAEEKERALELVSKGGSRRGGGGVVIVVRSFVVPSRR